MAVARTIFGSSAAITMTLASLASDANLSTGRCGTAIDLTAQSTFPMDVLIAGTIAISSLSTTTVVGGQIQVRAAGAAGSTVYTGGLSSADAGQSFTGGEQLLLPVVATIVVSTTPVPVIAAQSYAFGPVALAPLFGGVLPEQFNLFVVQNTGAALAVAGNALSYMPVYFASS
jgi:hypothetical protein